jgi:endonuclease/exonuclease/phosphatase family metal-dependent hydrolase
MRSTLSPRPVRRSLLAVLAVLVAMAATLALAVQAPTADATGPKTPPGAAKAAAPAKTTTVMTRNLYLGTPLTGIVNAIASGNQQAIVQQASIAWGNVQASQPEARMAAIAREIAKARPDVVGLQEVTRWTTYAYDPQSGEVSSPAVRYDFLALLLDALADRGVRYREVAGATADNFSSAPIPVLTGGAFPTTAVQLEDRDVILARAGVNTRNAQSGNFDTILEPPFSPIAIERGWGSVDVRTKLARYRFVNSHLEAFEDPLLEGIRVAQVAELFAAQDAIAAQYGALPEVYVGDYNTAAPNAPAYLALRGRPLADAWLGAGSGPGLTCCTSLTAPNLNLETRIDLVLHTPGTVRARAAEIVGDDPVSLPGGVRWASDHMGVVARLVVG